MSVTLLHFKRNSVFGKAVTAFVCVSGCKAAENLEVRTSKHVVCERVNFNYRGNTDSKLSVQAAFFCDKAPVTIASCSL
jgi:hypothetical protein